MRTTYAPTIDVLIFVISPRVSTDFRFRCIDAIRCNVAIIFARYFCPR